jgi:hypothetical protein
MGLSMKRLPTVVFAVSALFALLLISPPQALALTIQWPSEGSYVQQTTHLLFAAALLFFIKKIRHTAQTRRNCNLDLWRFEPFIEEIGRALREDFYQANNFAAAELDASGRAALEAAEADVEFRQQAVRVYHGDYYPSVKLSSSYGGQAFPQGTFPSGMSDFRRDWSASLTVSVPLFDGMRTHGAVVQAQADLSRAEAQLAQTREGVAIEIEQARAEIVRARALVAARHETVGQASRAQHLASVRYANGIATDAANNHSLACSRLRGEVARTYSEISR